MSQSQMWEDRYDTSDYVYGVEPNDFLREALNNIEVGDALCLADGEGRNGVYLATLGHNVTSVDFSETGMAKASQLATDSGVKLSTIVADLAEFDFGVNKWNLIVSIFAHTDPSIRKQIHSSIAKALRPGGYFVLEAYTPDQLGRGTGGPPNAELMMTLDGLRSELKELEFLHQIEITRSIVEGAGHTGDGAVVQVIARVQRK